MARNALIMMVVIGLSGCSSLYRQDSNCPGYIENGTCRDLRETYEATHEFDRSDYRARLRAQQEDRSRSRKRRRSGPSSNEDAGDAKNPIVGYAPMMVGDAHPRPILTQAIPVRVFVDPFEDEDGRLHTPGFIYVRATEPEWIFGGKEASDSRVITPLVPSR